MTDETPILTGPLPAPPGGTPGPGPLPAPAARVPHRDHRGSWVPTWGLVVTRRLELRKRRGLMVAVLLLTVGLPVVFLGIRLLLHAVDPRSYGPAGGPSVFSGLTNTMYFFGFIIAATLGATAGTSDLNDGVFRHLVVTGRSRMALFLARIPAGLSIILPLVAAAFTLLCLVTVFAAGPQPTTLDMGGMEMPLHLDKAQLATWIGQQDPAKVMDAFGFGGSGAGGGSTVVIGPAGSAIAIPNAAPTEAAVQALVGQHIDDIYTVYTTSQDAEVNPPDNEMVKIGLWIELEAVIGLVVGLGFGALIGQRTVATIIMIVLEVIVTPIAANANIPHFVNGQRLIVGVAMDQLRPAALSGGFAGPGGRGQRAVGIAPMPTWAMVSVIVGWIVVWSVLGAWRMSTRDA